LAAIGFLLLMFRGMGTLTPEETEKEIVGIDGFELNAGYDCSY